MAAAFEKLKSLEGTWQSVGADGKKEDNHVRSGCEAERAFRAIRGRGHAPRKRDSGRLLLTHYCMSGNQPRMQATSFDAAAGDLKFDFLMRRT